MVRLKPLSELQCGKYLFINVSNSDNFKRCFCSINYKATFTDKQFYESKGRMSHSSRFKDTAVNRICNSENRAGYLKIRLRGF